MTHYILLTGALVMLLIGIIKAVRGEFDVMASALFVSVALFLIFKFGPRLSSKTSKDQMNKKSDAN